jgi:hypothetical protein
MKTVLDIIMYILVIVGCIVSAWQIFLCLKPHRKVSWREIEKGVLELIKI